MNTLRRWTTSVASHFDWLIRQVENHEALVDSALQEMRAGSTKAKRRLSHVRRDGNRMKERFSELRTQEELWCERAKSVHQESEEKALECVRRAKQCRKEMAKLEQHIAEHGALERQLEQDLRIVDERIELLRRKKNELAARESRSDVLHIGKEEELGIVSELDDIFDRWEGNLEAKEYIAETQDGFESEFLCKEEASELRDELSILLSED